MIASSTLSATIQKAVEDFRLPVFLLKEQGGNGIGVSFADADSSQERVGLLPGVRPEVLGDPSMNEVHGIRYPYVCGEMANGIATTEMVVASARYGVLGFFGAAGLSLERIERSVAELNQSLGAKFSWGSNLIHSLNDLELEERTVDLYLKHGVRRVSASAFMAVRPSVVRYAFKGVIAGPDGTIIRPNHVFAKVSRPELAKQFLSPAPEAILQALLAKGELTAEEVNLARRLPVAEDLTVEADSGGHTDNRPLVVLLPTMLSLRDELQEKYQYDRPIRVGAAGGLGSPSAVAASFAMGAAYVLTGSINQCTKEAGQSEHAKQLLAQAGVADVMMAPAGDMFEMGVKVQVLKRGCFFPVRALKLYDLYTRYESLESLPKDVVESLEKDFFQQKLEQVWAGTRSFFLTRNPKEAERGDREAKHRMALVFRSYLGQSSRWSIEGVPAKKMDYQIWCGPAMGAFNQWVSGSFLQPAANRTVGEIALNLMHGAASITRAHQLRSSGVAVPPRLFHYSPRALSSQDSRNAVVGN